VKVTPGVTETVFYLVHVIHTIACCKKLPMNSLAGVRVCGFLLLHVKKINKNYIFNG